jgi:hypothetical protein
MEATSDLCSNLHESSGNRVMGTASTSAQWLTDIREALACASPTSGLTHNFYHYPARFSPAIARAVIRAFSQPGDVILDPFMGGGTTIIEALALGRRAVGTDLNSLAHFVAEVRTTPFSAWDEKALREWTQAASLVPSYADAKDSARSGVENFPRAVEIFMSRALELADRSLTLARRRNFARCALLRLGQWVLDCRDFASPRRTLLARQLPVIVEEMFSGLAEFVRACGAAGLPKRSITRNRHLIHADSKELSTLLPGLERTVKVVFTSPPYPGVHVLYHRWQYRGRRETAAPYWIAGVKDGEGGAYYTAGSRTPTGERNYFATIRSVFESARKLVAPDAFVVQLVGFARAHEQLPLYLDAMTQAGFSEYEDMPDAGLGRRVPNRKWYAKLKGEVDASAEVLLIHRPTI